LCATILISSATVARAEHYAILYAGGSEMETNYSWYYEEISRAYYDLKNRWSYKPENIWIIFADGLDPGIDQYRYTSANVSSDWSTHASQGAHVLSATRTNTFDTLRGLRALDPHDMFYFYCYDHGFGTLDDKNDHSEEGISGWDEGPAGAGQQVYDNELASYSAQIHSERKAYMFGQCFSGGMLEELGIDDEHGNEFGCASATHFEKSYSNDAIDSLPSAWNDAVDAGYTTTHMLYITARNDMATHWDPDIYFYGGSGPGSPVDEQLWMVTHPWKLGGNINMAIARWQGDGTGGPGPNNQFDSAANWTNTVNITRTTIIEFDSAGRCIIDERADPGWVSIDSTSLDAIGTAWVELVEGGRFYPSNYLVIGDVAYGHMKQTGGTNMPTRAVLGAKADSYGLYEMSGGYLATNAVDKPALLVGKRGYGLFIQSGGQVHLGWTGETPLVLGQCDGGSGEYRISGAAAVELEAPSAILGDEGDALFTQNGGTVRLNGNLLMAGEASSEAVYNLNTGRLEVVSAEIGWRGDATFTQNDGTVVISGDLLIAGAGTASYTIHDGTFTATNVDVGFEGIGSFTQAGGQVTISQELRIASATGEGDYTLSNGQLNASKVEIGLHGTGVFEQSGGTVQLTNDLWLGTHAGGDGTYEITDGTLNVRDDTIHVGTAGGGTVQFDGGTVIANELIVGSSGNLTAADIYGTLRVNKLSLAAGADETVGNLQIGHGSGQTYGLVSLSNASRLTVKGDLKVGYSGATTSIFNQNGADSEIIIERDLHVGFARNGIYRLTGSGADLTTRDVYVAYAADGGLEHSAGRLTARDVMLGRDGATGSYTLGGGYLAVGDLIVGQGGTGAFTQTGGQVHATNVDIGGGEEGSYALRGGSLHADSVHIGRTSTGTMTWDGGGLVADSVTVDDHGRLDVDAYALVNKSLSVAGGVLDATGQTLAISDQSGGTACLSLFSGEVRAGTLKLGHNHNGRGYFQQNKHTCTLGKLEIAPVSTGYGEYRMQSLARLEVPGGTIEIGKTGGEGKLSVGGGTVIANEVYVGENGTLTGSLGGVLRINRLTGSLDVLSFQAGLQFGHAAGWGEGRHMMTAGETLLVGRDFCVGQEADASVWQAGGTTLHVERDVHIAAGASTIGAHYLDGTGAQLEVEGGLYIGGTSASAGGEGTLTVDYAGKAAIGGTLKIWGDGTVNLNSGELIADQIVKTAGATFNFTGGRLCTKAFPGNLTNPAGTVAPGLSPGVMTVSGNYTQGADATLEIELGGGARGSQYDALDVNGLVTLDGGLDVTMINGYTPYAGQEFDILDWWGALSGTFNSLELPVLSDLAWDITALYTTGELSVVSTGPGDRTWTGAVGPGSPGGVFSNAGNWTPDLVPDAYDRAKFTLDNTYTVQFGADVTNDRARVSTGNVMLQGTGSPTRTYTLADSGTSLSVTDGRLTIEDLHVEAAGEAQIGATPYTARLTVGDGGRLSCDKLRLGAASGPATFEVLDGGVLAADEIVKSNETFTTRAGSEVRANTLSGIFGTFYGDLRLGHSGGTSVHTVGAGDALTVQQELSVGYDAQATLTALGGDVTIGQRLRIGDQAGSDGTLAINGASSDLNVTMLSYVAAAGVGQLQLIGGGSATFTQGVQIGASAAADGLISVSGTDSALTVDTNAQVGFAGDGRLEVGAGGSAHVMGWTHVAGQGGSTGAVSVGGSSATLALDGDVYIGGSNTAAGGSNTAAGGTGTLTVNNGGSATVGGTLKVWNTGAVNLAGGLLTAPTIQVNSGGAFTAAAGRLRTTTFTGNLVNSGGVIGSSSSTGTTTVNGGYTQGASGVLEIELGGLTRSSQYDVLDVNGLVTLGGELEVMLINGFSPAAGNTFDVLDWNSRNGEFDDLDLPSLAPGLLWDTSALYSTGRLVVGVGEVDDYTWDGGGGVPPTGDFFVAANWNPEIPPGPPGPTHQAKFTVLNQSYTVRFDDTFTNERARISGSAGETVTFDGTSVSNPKYRLTFVDSATPGLDLTGGHLTITDMHVDAAGDVRVGATPTASRLTIGSGGKLTCRELKIKFGGGTGAVEVLSSGTIIVDSMRKLSSGVFTSAAGSHVYTNHLYTWPEFNGNVNFGHRYGHGPTAADYTLTSTRALDIGDDFTVGYNAPATFTQQGDVNVGGDVCLGYANGGDGTYDLEGGTLTVGAWVRIETGKFTQSGGILNGGIHNQGTYRYTGGTLNGDLFNAGVLELLTNMTVHGRLGIASDTTIGDNRTVNVDESLEVGMAVLTIAGTHGVVNTDSALVGVLDDATVRVHDGDLHINGLLTLGDDGVGRVEVQGGSANLTAGNIQVGTSAAGEFIQAGWVEVNDTLTVGSGSGPGTGLYELSNGVLTAETIVVEANGTFNFTGGKLQADAFQGSLVNAGGTLAPGSSPSLMTVSGNYTQESNSRLEIELQGLSRGGQYDALVVSGTMTLAGELEVILGFSPSEGDSFDILDWGSLAGGEFDIVDLPELDGGKAWDTSALYSNGTISVSVAQTYDGDTDRDGDVDADDLAYFESVFGVVGDRHADFNENGRVDLGDFALMRANFGVGASSSPSVGPETETPEPIALVLLIAGLPVVLRRRQDRR